MTTHQFHQQVAAHLKRAHGHLAKLSPCWPQDQAPCGEIAQQNFAEEKAITNAKPLVHDHIDHSVSTMANSESV